MKLTPAASTRTSASPALGVGSGTLSYVSTSGPPSACMRTAFTISLLVEQVSRSHEGHESDEQPTLALGSRSSLGHRDTEAPRRSTRAACPQAEWSGAQAV